MRAEAMPCRRTVHSTCTLKRISTPGLLSSPCSCQWVGQYFHTVRFHAGMTTQKAVCHAHYSLPHLTSWAPPCWPDAWDSALSLGVEESCSISSSKAFVLRFCLGDHCRVPCAGRGITRPRSGPLSPAKKAKF